jgi:hypothetical protein
LERRGVWGEPFQTDWQKADDKEGIVFTQEGLRDAAVTDLGATEKERRNVAEFQGWGVS